jgi:mannose-6-phosphate isomerase
MSFMFKPLAYDDLTAINRPVLSSSIKESIAVGNENVAAAIIKSIGESTKSVILIDGYAGSNFSNFAYEIQEQIRVQKSKTFDMKDVYLSEEKINEMTKLNLPLNYEDDPVLLFGKLFEGKTDDLIDMEK